MTVSILYFSVLLKIVSVLTLASIIEDEKQHFVQLLLECTKQYPLTAADLEYLKMKRMPNSYAVKCMFACAYKRSGMMDDQGYLSVEGVNAVSRKVFADDPTGMTRAMEFTEACRSVNDEPVSDGSQGCERAALIFTCSVEKAPQFDFGP